MNKFIDMHTHIGRWSVDNQNFSKNQLCDVININEAQAFIVSNLDCIDMDENGKPRKTEIDGNEEILKEFADVGNAYLLAVCEPNFGSPDNIRKLLNKYPMSFCGLKLHSEFCKVPADSGKYDGYMEIAQEFKLPCLFHCGYVQSEYSSPRELYSLAKRFPTVPVILGHMSTGPVSCKREAVKVMRKSIENNDALLYGDISWCDAEQIVMIVEKLKNTPSGDFTNRILFGTDAPLGPFDSIDGYGAFLAMVETVIGSSFDEMTLYNILYSNSKKLFKINI